MEVLVAYESPIGRAETDAGSTSGLAEGAARPTHPRPRTSEPG